MPRRKREPLTPEKLEAKRRYDEAIKEATAEIIKPDGILDLESATEVMDKAFERHGFPELFRQKVSSSSAESIIIMKQARDKRIDKKLKNTQKNRNEER